jgi:hypothetical protein
VVYDALRFKNRVESAGKITFITNLGFIVAEESNLLNLDFSTQESIRESIIKEFKDGLIELDAISVAEAINKREGFFEGKRSGIIPLKNVTLYPGLTHTIWT